MNSCAIDEAAHAEDLHRALWRRLERLASEWITPRDFSQIGRRPELAARFDEPVAQNRRSARSLVVFPESFPA